MKGDNPTPVTVANGVLSFVPPVNNGIGQMTLAGDNSAFTGTYRINTGAILANSANAVGSTTNINVQGQVTYNSLNETGGTANSSTIAGGTFAFNAFNYNLGR